MTQTSDVNFALITGPMFAGKTTYLIGWINRVLIEGKEVLVVKPQMDKRYATEAIVSHNRDQVRAVVINEQQPEDILTVLESNNYIFIDEAQFFEENGLHEVIKTLLSMGKKVVVAGLDRNHKGEYFAYFNPLKELADQFIRLKAVCYHCGGEAEYTHRKQKGEAKFLVGGTEAYEPLCEEHFQGMIQKQNDIQ